MARGVWPDVPGGSAPVDAYRTGSALRFACVGTGVGQAWTYGAVAGFGTERYQISATRGDGSQAGARIEPENVFHYSSADVLSTGWRPRRVVMSGTSPR